MDYLTILWPTLYPWLLGVAAPFLLWKTVQFVGRNYVALSGISVQSLQSEDIKKEKGRGGAFVCRLQNLESVPFDHPVVIRITALLTDSLSCPQVDCVQIYAGWRAFDCSIETAPARFCWTAKAVCLPAFDTWTFEFRLPANEIVFEVFAEGQETRKFFKPQFGKEIWPNSLIVYQTDKRRSRFEGPSMVPALQLPLLTSAFAAFFHLLVVRLLHTFNQAGGNVDVFSAIDLKIILCEIGAIFCAYFLIRRRVQPVVPGYSDRTPVVTSIGLPRA